MSSVLGGIGRATLVRCAGRTGLGVACDARNEAGLSGPRGVRVGVLLFYSMKHNPELHSENFEILKIQKPQFFKMCYTQCHILTGGNMELKKADGFWDVRGQLVQTDTIYFHNEPVDSVVLIVDTYRHDNSTIYVRVRGWDEQGNSGLAVSYGEIQKYAMISALHNMGIELEKAYSMEPIEIMMLAAHELMPNMSDFRHLCLTH